MRTSKVILILFSIVGFIQIVIAQTCCSGGVPISNNLGIAQGAKGTLVTALSWDYNYLNTLKTGSTTLDQNNRVRGTHSALLQLGYSISDRFSGDLLLPVVAQERTITTLGGDRKDITFGLGDISFLVKYQLLQDATGFDFNIGMGIKLPTGLTNIEDNAGIIYNADLQPGSGSIDYIWRTQASYSIPRRPQLKVISTAIFSLKGKNEEYLGNNLYQFGNELQIIFGLSEKLLLGKQILDMALLARYRTVQNDKFNNGNLPGTGGKWIFIQPNITWWATPSLGISLQIETPLFAEVVNTQLSPTIRTNFGIMKKLNL